MKRIMCPKCKTQMVLKSEGNVNGEKFKTIRKKRDGSPRKRIRTTEGSKYQMVLTCRCREEHGEETQTTVIARSKADARRDLKRHLSRLAAE